MVKRLQVLCGLHPELPINELPEAEERVFGIDGKWYTIDICEKHGELLDQLRELAKNKVAERIPDDQKPVVKPGTVGRPALIEGRAVCPFCADNQKTYSDGGLRMHCDKTHGFGSQKTETIYGFVCPLCKQREQYSLALTGHIRKEHKPANSIAAAFIMARDNGDPHGIVAQRFKLASNVTAKIKKG